jgi:hypothetical protein
MELKTQHETFGKRALASKRTMDGTPALNPPNVRPPAIMMYGLVAVASFVVVGTIPHHQTQDATTTAAMPSHWFWPSRP